jgi:DNA-binding transcriptional regulator YiaG
LAYQAELTRAETIRAEHAEKKLAIIQAQLGADALPTGSAVPKQCGEPEQCPKKPAEALGKTASSGEPLRVTPNSREDPAPTQASLATLPLHSQIHIRSLELKCENALRLLAEAELSLERSRIAQVAQKPFKAKPVFFRDKLLHLVTKQELAQVFGVSPDLIQEWSSRGVLPSPIEFPRPFLDSTGQPITRADDRGNKTIRWDLQECLDTAMRFKRRD